MKLLGTLGNRMKTCGESLIQKELETKYGQQIGKTANNGSKTFQRKAGDEVVTTGLNHNNNVIGTVRHEGDNIKGTTKKIRTNEDGDIVEVSHSRRATNYRKNVSENLKTGEVKAKVLAHRIIGGQAQQQVTTTLVDKHGKVDTSVRDVAAKSK